MGWAGVGAENLTHEDLVLVIIYVERCFNLRILFFCTNLTMCLYLLFSSIF